MLVPQRVPVSVNHNDALQNAFGLSNFFHTSKQLVKNTYFALTASRPICS